MSAASGLNIWNIDAAVVSVMLDIGRPFVNAHIHGAGAMMATLIPSPDLPPRMPPNSFRGGTAGAFETQQCLGTTRPTNKLK